MILYVRYTNRCPILIYLAALPQLLSRSPEISSQKALIFVLAHNLWTPNPRALWWYYYPFLGKSNLILIIQRILIKIFFIFSMLSIYLEVLNSDSLIFPEEQIISKASEISNEKYRCWISYQRGRKMHWSCRILSSSKTMKEFDKCASKSPYPPQSTYRRSHTHTSRTLIIEIVCIHLQEWIEY